LRVEKELAWGFGPGHKAGYEKLNSTPANAGKVLTPAPTMQPYSQPFGASIGPRARRGGEEPHLPSVEPWGRSDPCPTDARLGLNDVCDALRLHSGPLPAIRGATPPGKNALSHANRQRDARLAVGAAPACQCGGIRFSWGKFSHGPVLRSNTAEGE
jgi:hypothetical protein